MRKLDSNISLEARERGAWQGRVPGYLLLIHTLAVADKLKHERPH